MFKATGAAITLFSVPGAHFPPSVVGARHPGRPVLPRASPEEGGKGCFKNGNCPGAPQEELNKRILPTQMPSLEIPPPHEVFIVDFSTFRDPHYGSLPPKMSAIEGHLNSY
jgi:hypothetical protein